MLTYFETISGFLFLLGKMYSVNSVTHTDTHTNENLVPHTILLQIPTVLPLMVKNKFICHEINKYG